MLHYFTAITEPLFPEWYYNRNGTGSPCLSFSIFVILTVDNRPKRPKRNAGNSDTDDGYPQSEPFLLD